MSNPIKHLRGAQAGFTLTEMLVVTVVVGVAAAAALVASGSALSREAGKSTAYDVRTLIQLARMEAAKRNHACRFQIAGGDRLQVVDTMGTPSTTDDRILHDRRIPSSVTPALPAGGSPITLQNVSGVYQAVFEPDGTVSAGAGSVTLYGGGQYRRVNLYVAGGVETLKWDGSHWVPGS